MATPALTVLEEDRHAWFAGRTRAILKYLDAELGSNGDGQTRKVLDLGGGAGNMAHHLAHYGEVTSIDYNPRPIPIAQRRGVTVLQGSGDHLPFPDASFGLVALLDTVEHIPDELGVFAECARVLKPGGVLLVTVPAYMWLWSYNDEINAHERRYTADELRLKLELSGLRVSRISYNNFFLFPAVAGIRFLRPYNPGLKSPHLDAAEEVYQVDMEPIPEPINSVLHGVYWLEAEILERMSFPFGNSIICTARK
ncbi:MAG: class I SAM-dependent methyltransferase [Caldilineaceae bacterium]|jgi:SAM-dependent methyltransferase|nr:class I SAM-dependent methyltransferase [Caldilineaceae bacterium]